MPAVVWCIFLQRQPKGERGREGRGGRGRERKGGGGGGKKNINVNDDSLDFANI